MDNVAMMGVSCSNTSFSRLGQMALSPAEVTSLYEVLVDSEAVESALVLSTCNRVEIYASIQPGKGTVEDLWQNTIAMFGAGRFANRDELRFCHGHETAQYFMRVCCGLESLIVGETQILGQVKAAYEQMCQYFSRRTSLNWCIEAAMRAGSRSRTETSVGRGAVSVASAAVQLAAHIYVDLSKCHVVLIGAGQTAILVAKHFKAHGVSELCFVNRTFEHALQAAKSLGGRAVKMDELHQVLSHADIVAVAVHGTEPVVTSEVYPRQRGQRALCLFDLSMPAAVAPSLHQLPNVFVHDLEAIQKVIDSNVKKRSADIDEVEALIAKAMLELERGINIARLGPAIGALRHAVEASRRDVLAAVGEQLSVKERHCVDQISRLVINRLLHEPTIAFRELAAEQQDYHGHDIEFVRQLFARVALSLSSKEEFEV